MKDEDIIKEVLERIAPSKEEEEEIKRAVSEIEDRISIGARKRGWRWR